MKRWLAAILVAPIRAYQRWVSPAMAPRCRYYPTCSAYAVQAIRELGPVRGLFLAAWRVLRCNPWSHGGVDKLEDRRLFKDTPTRSERKVQHKRPPQAPRPDLPPQAPRPDLPPAGGSGGARLT